MQQRIRKAQHQDLEAIIKMLADDKLGAKREKYQIPLPECYHRAFQTINQDPNHELMVLEEVGEVIGTLQLSFLPYLTYQGGWRAQIEAVRVRSDQRGKGLGGKLFAWAIARARERGAHLIQLTTDKKRPDAKKFYEQLGFLATHEGMKLHIFTPDK